MNSCVGRDTNAKCVTYTGPDIPEYGIQAGMDMQEVIALLTQTKNSSTKTTSPVASAVEYDAPALYTSFRSSCLQSITNTVLSYRVFADSSFVTLSYDFGGIIKSLPSGYSLVDVAVTFTDDSGMSNSSKDRRGEITLDRGSSEYIVDISAQVKTECDIVLLDQRVVVSALRLNRDFKTVLQAKDMTPRRVERPSLIDVISELLLEVSILKQQVDSLSGMESLVNSVETELKLMRSNR
jgi:hypothetical protein